MDYVPFYRKWTGGGFGDFRGGLTPGTAFESFCYIIFLVFMSTVPSSDRALIVCCVEQVCKAHSGLLGKGLALTHSPTILEALEGNLPLHLQTNEHSFLEDFITCVQNSSGGRLARLVSKYFQLPLFIKNVLFSIFTILLSQVASARLLRRPSEDRAHTQQRRHPLWLAHYCCGADQRPIWRCCACAKHEG